MIREFVDAYDVTNVLASAKRIPRPYATFGDAAKWIGDDLRPKAGVRATRGQTAIRTSTDYGKLELTSAPSKAEART
jgi:hypothetical protein